MTQSNILLCCMGEVEGQCRNSLPIPSHTYTSDQPVQMFLVTSKWIAFPYLGFMEAAMVMVEHGGFQPGRCRRRCCRRRYQPIRGRRGSWKREKEGCGMTYAVYLVFVVVVVVVQASPPTSCHGSCFILYAGLQQGSLGIHVRAGRNPGSGKAALWRQACHTVKSPKEMTTMPLMRMFVMGNGRG
ncbi:hypothetical protein EX30DRAFT_265128 [Ascodesmis nigricans]|uniref:Uncharacterized protein n=1 Tax=Ascodesmis nigricans TaxID=341454 RepID=A0A4S2MXY0_9PEZI|nr:hypothetical protein EX30DRAFT_265128 [Ascodesmis nigricans]